ncbi:hypothetical protein [Amycolatopsis circi]|uniref:hypothetical protein n=1 Tax=Amycolatopsis circi TaxID=871959 RepID=UPI000E27AE4F|nr:hypothetical protein [Amycolatopsis circi]
MNLATEPETLGDLIADCAHFPSALRPERSADQARLPLPRAARPWTVDDDCHAQVADLDAYV